MTEELINIPCVSLGVDFRQNKKLADRRYVMEN